MFLSCALWFITDTSSKADIIVDRNVNKSYAVLDVIKQSDESESYPYSLNHEDQDNMQEEARSSSYGNDNRFSMNISDRMIEQFFEDIVEGPDRNWKEEYDYNEVEEPEDENNDSY